MYADLIFCCRKLVAIHDVYDELYAMRIHNIANCESFSKEIDYLISQVNELSGELLQKENK